MGASIHIKGTASSTVDSIFVCRCRQGRPLPLAGDLAVALTADLNALRDGGLVPTLGDSRCMAYGHIIRQAVNTLMESWRASQPVEHKLERLARYFAAFGGQEAVRMLTGETRPLKGAAAHSDQVSLPVAAKGSAHAPISV